MKLALSVHQGHISTVFDAASDLLIVDPYGGMSRQPLSYRFTANDPVGRAAEMMRQGIGVLVCGAISRPMENCIAARGIKLYPFVRGSVEEIVDAYLANRLDQANFFLPGCRRAQAGSQRRHRGGDCGRGRQGGGGRGRFRF